MNTPELIRQKREGGELTPEQIRELVGGFLAGTVKDYQMGAFLMAVFFRGMTPRETASLTRTMRDSGDVFDLSDIDGPKVDKHSTGGVGDKVSLTLAPLVAAAGVRVPMVSGRALGHTGGTLDKLDAIAGYRWALSGDEFKDAIRRAGCAIIGQTPNFVPADRRLYAMRDVTATVESIPLICASILSKKAASGALGLVMDVKFGSGAFMPTTELSRELARQLVAIGTELGLPTTALLTRMDRPLGAAVGNALEVREAFAMLRNEGPADYREVTLRLGAEMLLLAGVARKLSEAEATLSAKLRTGAALDTARRWIEAQGGDPRVLDDPARLEVASDVEVFTAPAPGVIAAMDTRTIGVAANVLGAGRRAAEDAVDLGVGFVFERKTGDAVSAGDAIARIHHRGGRGLDEARRLLASAIRIGAQAPAAVPVVLERITRDGAA